MVMAPFLGVLLASRSARSRHTCTSDIEESCGEAKINIQNSSEFANVKQGFCETSLGGSIRTAIWDVCRPRARGYEVAGMI